MRLRKIKLAGFKSFVDPTTIPINGNLIGVVGPNGCGKSNIIDAVRWVMGETSAKHLRGDSMEDVIFNGSNARKPVGQASIELVFDNSDGSAGGQYAAYAEISVRREAARDGRSDYFLNKTRCRRKDITDLFLGTGLGPRAYSIIEQGMITRIIEARPEDLRGFVEEAAGISRYKERRRETENRIRHTRENLDRVEDIRKELGTQLARLERQSKAAAKYKELKSQERLLRAQLLALRWRGLNAEIQQQDREIAQRETALDAALARQRAIEAEIEHLRAHQTEANDAFNQVQGDYYAVGAEIAGIEQAIQHARETRQQRQHELDEVSRAWDQASGHLQTDGRRLEELGQRLAATAPEHARWLAECDRTAQALAQAEQAMTAWQAEWQGFAEVAAEPGKVREIQSHRVEQLRRQIAELEGRRARLEQERTTIARELEGEDIAALRAQVAGVDRAWDEQQRRLTELEQEIKALRVAREQARGRLDELQARQHGCDARLTSLRELQAAARSQHDDSANEWLGRHGLADAPLLAGRLSVEPGWERAVERVLGIRLGAVCVPALDPLAAELQGLKLSELALVEAGAPAGAAPQGAPRLLHKVQADLDLAALLADVHVAEDLAEALARRGALAAHESIITRSGEWVGRNWLSLANEAGERAGMLEREREIVRLAEESAQGQAELARARDRLAEVDAGLRAREAEHDTRQKESRTRQNERAQLRDQLARREARRAQLEERRTQVQRDQDDIRGQLERLAADVEQAQRLLQEAQGRQDSHETRRGDLIARRDRLTGALEQARRVAAEARETLHRLEVERQGLQTAFESTQLSVTRLEGQLAHLVSRRQELEAWLADNREPETGLKAQLEAALKRRLEVEQRLTGARQAVAELDTRLRDQELARHQQERQVQAARHELEHARMDRQGLAVRLQTLQEQVRETGLVLEELVQALSEDAAEAQWQEQLDQLATRIDRLGPINLMAIEEFEEQSQRKGFLDDQSADLAQALATLEEAIRKIDRETRTRFKETFDRINTGFQAYFPKLFGGGHAYLELTDEDLLSAGVTVMARPPGKRNSTIHLLSGGEKALTAVALMFSIFELNPAPFCLLDEVDAPLDDANVERYSETLKAMAERTQLIYITHNKIAMEMAQVLVGVTMSEPGVSRLVSVDVEEALKMVAQ